MRTEHDQKLEASHEAIKWTQQLKLELGHAVEYLRHLGQRTWTPYFHMNELNETADIRSSWKPLFSRHFYSLTVPLACGAVFGSAFAFLQPMRFYATASLIIPEASAGAGLLRQSGPTQLGILEGIAKSVSVKQRIKELTSVSGEQLKSLTWKSDEGANKLTALFEDTSSDRALAVIKSSEKALSEVARNVNRSISQSESSELQSLLDSQVDALVQKEKAFTIFQKGLQSTPGTSRLEISSEIQALRAVEQELMEVNAQLEFVRRNTIAGNIQGFAAPNSTVEKWQERVTEAEVAFQQTAATQGPESPEYRRSKITLDVTQEKLRQEISRAIQSIKSGLDPDVAKLEARKVVLALRRNALTSRASVAPEESRRLQDWIRDISVLEDRVNQVQKQLQAAVVRTETLSIRYAVLDPPLVLPGSKLDRLLEFMAFGGALGTVFGILFVSFKEFLRSRRHQPPGKDL